MRSHVCSLVDVLTNSVCLEPGMTITPGQKRYYNYRFDKASFDAERTSGSGPQRSRDFRSLRERRQDHERHATLPSEPGSCDVPCSAD
jgi:hypothetical protein